MEAKDTSSSNASRHILLNETQAARELCTLSARLKRWAKDGLISYVELPNGDIRFRLSDLEEFAASRAVKAEVKQ